MLPSKDGSVVFGMIKFLENFHLLNVVLHKNSTSQIIQIFILKPWDE